MKKLISVTLFTIGIALLASGSNPLISKTTDSGDKISSLLSIDQQKKETAAVKTVYTCSMHPEINQEKTGKCPKCGMNLIAKEVKKDVYTCPMHSEVTQDKAGKCTKCGMNLVKKEAEKKPETVKK